MARAAGPFLILAEVALLGACVGRAEVRPAQSRPVGTVCSACAFQLDAYRLSQKITLTVGRSAYCFDGYLAVRKPGFLRASAFGEMGGRMFDFLVRPEGGQVLFQPGRIPSRPLLEGVVGDLRFLFLAGDAVGSTDTDGRVALAQEFRAGRVEREARFGEYRPLFEGAGWSGPGRIVLKNFRWHYGLEMENLALNPAPPRGRVFEAD